MEGQSPKRSADFTDGNVSKKPRLGSQSKMSFAERMMAKMGHKKGEGLGKDNSGIATPIEVKMRPQGVGVGAVKEKTPQAKAEARRQAERRGEKYEDSSDEEKEARRRRKEMAKKTRGSGFAPPGSAAVARPKQKFRTVEEIEAEEGLTVPNVFKSLIDMTGQQPRLLTSTAGLLGSQHTVSNHLVDSAKIAKSAQLELEAFADAWHDLQQRRKYVDMQQQQARRGTKGTWDETTRVQELCTAVEAISFDVKALSGPMNQRSLTTSTNALADRLANLSVEYGNYYSLEEFTVSTIAPAFKHHLNNWEPFGSNHEYLLSWFPAVLEKLKSLLNFQKSPEQMEDAELDGFDSGPRVATPYESMVLTLWLPKVRSAVVNDWSVHDAEPMLQLLQQWKPVLPMSVSDIVVNNFVVQKLTEALRRWRPASTNQEGDISRPHIWLFPWLPLLDEYHLDSRSSNGLAAEVKRKYRGAFATWDVSKGVTPGLDKWLEVRSLASELRKDLDLKLLPRLAHYLRDHLEVNPSDQDITPVEKVLLWQPFFRVETFGRVLLDTFFPKWLSVLHIWLTSDPNFEEVGQWFSWWQQEVFPAEVNEVPAVAAEWNRGLSMMNQALDMGPEKVKSELTAPVVSPDDATASTKEAAQTPVRVDETKAAGQRDQTVSKDDIATFKDILEDLCEQESLLMIPMRKAHPETGLPLFRITASASGTGGVQIYIKGDVAWAQNKKDRNTWEPIDVFEDGTLAALAEGK
ncbi:hypothetical protein FH972_021482 [Carpinus fangiana]|uniref:G-patch domain-containing protein n=1 Tax=Carpinus fangiana TaxID=176857 RepID=A0A5N6KPG1_9ROSI|nr:hypothetical protein FH972_021482 [Carpinus fangiana]